MATNEIDVVDVGPLVVFPIAAGMVLGVWSFGVDVFGGFNFTDPLWTVGGANISPALLLTVGAVVAILATNEIDGSSYENYEYGAIVAALLAVPAYEFIPAVQSIVSSHDILAFGLWLVIAAVATAIAYWE